MLEFQAWRMSPFSMPHPKFERILHVGMLERVRYFATPVDFG